MHLNQRIIVDFWNSICPRGGEIRKREKRRVPSARVGFISESGTHSFNILAAKTVRESHKKRPASACSARVGRVTR